MLVRSILQRKGDWVATVSGDTRISDVAAELVRLRIGAIVISNTGTQIDGILSERDIVRGVTEHGPSALDLPATALMTAQVLTCRLDDSIDSLMSVMTERRFRHLPVVSDDNQLLGIVSIGDVVNHRVEELRIEAKTLREYIVSGR